MGSTEVSSNTEIVFPRNVNITLHANRRTPVSPAKLENLEILQLEL